MNHQNVLWLLYTKSCKRHTQQQPHGYDNIADKNCFVGAGNLTTCVHYISLVAIIFKAALCFAFIERNVAHYGKVSFAELFTETFIYVPFENRIEFHWSIVERDMILQTCVSVIGLTQCLISLTFLQIRPNAVITVSLENTCGDRMIYLMIFSKEGGGWGKLKIRLVAFLPWITAVFTNRGYIFHAISF